MKFCFLFILAGFSCFEGFTQKTTSRQFNAEGIKEIYIVADEVYKIHISTISAKKVNIHTTSEGEYYNNIAIDVEQLKDRMNITSHFPEILQSGYDKLSAHKVFSLELNIEVPEGIRVYLESNIANVTGSGNFKELLVELQAGFCTLTGFTGDALVNTYNGAINVETTNASIEAGSRNGKVELPAPSPGKYTIKLSSINGDIKVEEN